jgi:L-lactate dehydrogenase (cytochrome)
MGRPHNLGHVAPVLKGKPGLSDFSAWTRKSFDASVTWVNLDHGRRPR